MRGACLGIRWPEFADAELTRARWSGRAEWRTGSVKLPHLLETVQMSRETVQALNTTLGKLIAYVDALNNGGGPWRRALLTPGRPPLAPRPTAGRFLTQHLDRFVMAEYDNAPPDYISLSKSA